MSITLKSSETMPGALMSQRGARTDARGSYDVTHIDVVLQNVADGIVCLLADGRIFKISNHRRFVTVIYR